MFAAARPLVLALALLCAAGAIARAGTRRLAIVVGQNAGAAGPPLRWAEGDARLVADVLVQVGGIGPGSLYVVAGQDLARLREVFVAAAGAVRALRQAPDDRIVLDFYFAGWSDGAALELGGERLSLIELRTLLASTGADVRVIVVDGHRRAAAAAAVDLVDQLAGRGDAVLIAASDDERGDASAERRGSPFTLHLATGLRGAADLDRDGQVTLAEAFAYARAVTGLPAAPAPPTPEAAAEIVTEVGGRRTAIELPVDADGARVMATPRDQLIAELGPGGARRIAVAPGGYAIRLWRAGAVVAGRLQIAEGEVAPVRWDQLQPITAAPVAPPTPTPTIAPAEPAPRDPYVDEHMLSFDVRGAAFGGSYRTYVGALHAPLDVDDFFHRLGREDLADAYRSRDALKTGLTWGGGAIIAAGIIYGVYKACFFESPALGSPRFSECIDDNGVALASVGGGGVVGAALLLLGIGLGNQPAPSDEVTRLTDEYNARLRARRVTTSIAPYAAPAGAGGGLMLRGQF